MFLPTRVTVNTRDGSSGNILFEYSIVIRACNILCYHFHILALKAATLEKAKEFKPRSLKFHMDHCILVQKTLRKGKLGFQ